MRRSKLICTIVFLLTFVQLGVAQYGTEWINYNQRYFKIPVGRTGAYQLDYNTLTNAGVPLASIDARTIRVYHRGEEIAIRVTGQNDTRLDQGDVIQFLAKANDGESDTPLYENPEDQPHTYYNLFSDTTAYFLTWRLDGQAGKRMQVVGVNNNVNNLPPEEDSDFTHRTIYTNSASLGQTYNPANEVYKSAFDIGEVWSGSPYSSTSRDFSVTGLVSQNRSAETPSIRVLIQGRNIREHNAEVFIGPNAGTLRSVGSANFTGYEYAWFSAELTWDDLSASGEAVVRVSANGTTDRISVSVIEIDYKRIFDANNQSNLQVSLNPNAGGESYVAFSNVTSNARLYLVDDFNEPVLLQANLNAGELNTVIENTTVARKLYLQNQSFITPSIKRVSMRDFSSINPTYVIISHPDLMQPSDEYTNPVLAYASYRSSGAGGAYDTLIADITRLYNQFNYGEVSPMAVYRFTRYLVENTDAELLFLVGKGLNWYHGYYRQSTVGANQYRDLVPTAGYPGSDNLYAFNIESPLYASIGIGRLNAHDPADVEAYLNKIKEMEAQPLDDLRRKNLLHLSGGLSAFEIIRFRNYVGDLRSDAIGPYLGGDVSIVTKQTNQVVELVNVSEEVNEGVSLITFFGHSETAKTDIDIGFVSNPTYGYNNKGKYPFILVNGCNAGSLYEQSTGAITFGEDWVNTPNKGGIGVMAHSAQGFSNELKDFSDQFYAKVFGDSSLIDQPIGKLHQEMVRAYIQAQGASPSELHISQAQQMNLMGDPAYVIFPAQAPDYAINDADLEINSFDGNPVTALTDSFAIDLIVKNYGRTQATTDSFGIVLRRMLPNNTIVVQDTQYVKPINYQDTARYIVRNEDIESFGLNTFELIIDPGDSISELNELNNIASIDYFVALSSTANLYPYPYSYVNNTSITLTAQSTDLLSEERAYRIEMDTTHTFDSPFLKSETLTAKVLVQWQTELLSQNNQTYYWRTRYANPSPEEIDEWTTSSFTYTTDEVKEGWVQNRIKQFSENQSTGLVFNANNYTFEQNPFNLEVRTYGHQENVSALSIRIDGTEFSTTGPQVDICERNSLNLVAFDRSTGVPYKILSNGGFDVLDPLTCGRRDQVINQLFNNQLANPSQYFGKYYDELPEGDFVMIASFDSVAFDVLLANNRPQLLDLGASPAVIDNLQNGDPYILLGRKGLGAGNGQEVIGNTALPEPVSEQEVVLNTQVNARFDEGSIRSVLVGPALSWSSILAETRTMEVNDAIQFDVFGVNRDRNESLLFSDATLPLDISAVDASQFPYLRLRVTISDPTDLTPAQLGNWEVIFDEAPDGVLLPGEIFSADGSWAMEGEAIPFPFRFVNVTPTDFTDSLKVEARIFNADTRNEEILTQYLTNVEANSTKQFVAEVNTTQKVGDNSITTSVNIEELVPERLTSNNLISLRNILEVKRDSLPPFIAVTFDGRSILDGDIVAPAPVIQVEVKDENTLLPLQDTTGVHMQLVPLCDGCVARNITFSNPRVEWSPATDEEPFTVYYRPDPLEDGQYQLRVNATDASENEAGEEPFAVKFEVVNRSTITHFYPYPNPFSTSTRFVFTLTGSELPDELKIQILTVTGRVVREILQDEIGPIHIGNNITEYAWDGRDEFGDILANGVYLYRVLVRKNGSFMEQRATSADKAFTKGYGKLYILR